MFTNLIKLTATRLRRKALRLCLCLALPCLWCVAPHGAAAQPQGTGAQTQPTDLEQARRLNRQALELYEEGRYAEAVPLAVRALAIVERVLKPDDPIVAIALNNLAHMYKESGDLARAEPLFRRALAIREKALGPDDPGVARTLVGLAGTYSEEGDLARAEPLYGRALAILERALGPWHPEVARTLNDLAGLHRERNDFARAEPLHQRALSILERALGPEHQDVASALNNLAGLYHTRGDFERAEPLYHRSLTIYEKALGPEHPKVARTLNNLGGLYKNQGDLARAEPLIRRALSIREKALGPEHNEVAISLNNLAGIYRAKGDFARAEPLYERSLAIHEKRLGPDHLYVALSLSNRAGLDEAKGDLASAVRAQSRAQELLERNLSLILSAGSERQKLAYLATLTGETYATVSLHARASPADPQALHLSLTTILRRKGRALDAMSDQVSSLRRRLDPQDRALLDQLSAAQSQLSQLVLNGPGNSPPEEHRAAVSRLEAEADRLQDAVSRRSAEFRARTQPVTIEQVRAAIPPGAALVEFFSYHPFDAKAKTDTEVYGPARYVAYVLGVGGDPVWADLGGADEVDASVARLLSALKCPQGGNSNKQCPPAAQVRQLARAADERVMRPVRALLGDARHVIISPDGGLNLLPFAALVDERGKHLVESYSITYLTSGRDLLRMRFGVESRRPALVLGDPVFDEARERSDLWAGAQPSRSTDARPTRSADMQAIYFRRLRGTAEESKAVGSILAGARVLTGARATERAIKQASSPRVLHVATHGFFLPDQTAEPGATEAGFRGVGDGLRVLISAENPLLRSGLALAGANTGLSEGGEDGILTALEASALDLWGTKLVVLSACETGVGEIKNGDGVYGLRRALVLAGSESQVMSLWQVSDEATRDLMVAYYKRLRSGEGRTEALRQVQLEMLRGGARKQQADTRRGLSGLLGATSDRSHPFYWAAFIQSGDWRPMTTQPASAK